MSALSNPSPYLRDEYAPVSAAEEFSEWSRVPLVDGQIPSDLNGVLLRNCANPQFPPADHYNWLDGDGFIHGVSFESGRASYKGRFIRTNKFLEERAAGRSLYAGFTSLISRNRPLRSLRAIASYILAGTNPFPNTSNTDLVYHAGQLLSLWMLGGEAHVIDPLTLETIGLLRPPSPNGAPGGLAAHPKINPNDGALVGMDFVTSWTRWGPKKLILHRREADGHWSAYKEVALQGSRLLHDLGMTSEHVIILDMPAEMSVLGLRYRGKQSTRFGVLRADLKGEVQWFEDPTGCYMIHLVNTFERDGCIIIDALRKPTLVLAAEERCSMNGAFASQLHRWTLDLRTGRIQDDQCGVSLIEDLPFGFEFPSVSPVVSGLSHRFSYLPTVAPTSEFKFDGFLKYDHDNNTWERYRFQETCFGSEVTFVPRAAQNSEDDGWLLVFVHNVANGEVSLDIFDAQDVVRGPEARLGLPQRVPIGFHTTWISNERKPG